MKTLLSRETSWAARYLAAARAFDESKINRDGEGQFSETDGAGEGGESAANASPPTPVATLADAVKRSEKRETYPRGDSQKAVDALKALSPAEIKQAAKDAGIGELFERSKTGMLKEIYKFLDAGHAMAEKLES